MTILVALSINADSDSRSMVSREQCNADCFFQGLIDKKIDTIFMFQNSNFITGESGLIIWQKHDIIEGIKFMSDSSGSIYDPKSLISSKKATQIIYEYFRNSDNVDTMPFNPIEKGHDYSIYVRSFLNGKIRNHKFKASDIPGKNPKTTLEKVSMMSMSILYPDR